MRLKIAALAVLLAASSASAVEDNAKLGRKVWSAWACVFFAKNADKDSEAERLYEIGLVSARELSSRFLAGEVMSRENMPSAISMVLEGSSPDFIAGRIFQTIQQNTEELVFRRDKDFNPLPIIDRPNIEQRQRIAEDKFREKNCDLLE